MSYVKEYKAVARKVVKAALAKGYVVSVCDGEEWTVKKSSSLTEIIDALCTTDADTLRFRDAEGNKVGCIEFVYGNLPEEVIADYTANDAMEALVKVAD